MAQLNFGGVTETVVIRDEFPRKEATPERVPVALVFLLQCNAG